VEEQHRCRIDLRHVAFPRAALQRTIPDRFAEQVAMHGPCTAIRDRGRSITYEELDRWSSGIAHALLRDLGPAPENVALLFDQGAACIAAALGVLKAGKAYVPLDPRDDRERLGRMLELVRSNVVLVDQAAGLPGLPCVAVGGLSAARPPALAARAEDLACVYLTSGSTGEPKGVMDCHRNVLHNVLRYTDALAISPADRLTLLQAPTFSGAVSSTFCALLNGAACCPFRPTQEGPTELAGWLQRERITIYHSVPSLFRAICVGDRRFPSVRVVRLEGDRATGLDVELFERHLAPGSLLANGLGMTEAGLVCQLRGGHGELPRDGILPVGLPVSDVDVQILDRSGEPLPRGAVGEIAVSGDYLALGYWERPDLTSKAFRPGRDGRPRTYRTGDLGRLREDGSVEHLGRSDGQAKVRGRQVDLGDVEAALLRLPGVLDAAARVVEEDTPRGGRLVAYVVLESDSTLSAASLRTSLGGSSNGLVPSQIVPLESLPLGPNGKVDRRLLPPPPSPVAGVPQSGLETVLARIWSDVLGQEVGPDSDFFVLGGDSLAAVEIVSAVERETGRRLSPATFVAAPTLRSFVRQLASDVSNGPGSAVVPLTTGPARNPPFFLVHRLARSTPLYSELVAALGPQWFVWGVVPGLDDESASVDELAGRHAAAVRGLIPDGPYVVGGYCSDAVVAFDLARQLQEGGGEVALLVLLGISPLDLPSLLSDSARRRWSSPGTRIRRHLDRARKRPPAGAVAYLARVGVNVARRALPSAPPDTGLAAVVGGYRPTPATAPVLAGLDGETTARDTQYPASDWRGLTTGRLDIAVIDGPEHVILADGAKAAARTIAAVAASLQIRPWRARTIRTNSFVSS
jgi:amino acid adenylation domain-containing protein